MLLYGNFTRFFQAAGFYRNRRFSLFLRFYNTFSITDATFLSEDLYVSFATFFGVAFALMLHFLPFFRVFFFGTPVIFFTRTLALPGHLDCSGLFENTAFCCNFGCSCTHTGNYTFSSTAATFGLEELHSTVSSKESLCVRD